MKGAALSLLIAIVAAGCGGGGSETGTQTGSRTGTQPRSKSDYIALLDVICKNHQSRREDLESQAIELGSLDSKGKAHQVAGLLRQQSANLRAEVRELRAVQPAAGGPSTVEPLLSLQSAKADLIDDWAGAYDDLDAARIRALQARVGVATARAVRRARAYGFEVCGRD